MRIAVFGATGQTGRRVVAGAIARGHQVIAVSRKPPAPARDGVEWRRADVLVPDVLVLEQVDAALAGADAVIICLGPTGDDATCGRGTRLIIEAMRARGLERLACQTGVMIGHPRERIGWALRGMRRLFRARHPELAADRDDQERAVTMSGLHWTLVRPARLTGGPATPRLVAADARVPSLASSRRDDVAATLLDAVDSGRHVGEAVAVLSRPPLARLVASWTGTYALAELIGLALVALIMMASRGYTEGSLPAALFAGGLAGLLEGAVVGGLLGALLMTVRPEVRLRTWILGTIVGAVIAWALGSLPAALSGQAPAGPAPPMVWILVGAAGMGLAAGPILGGAQSVALRASGVRAGAWVLVNALGWAAGMPLVFLAASRPWDSPVAVARGLLLLALAGAVVGLVTALGLAHEDRRRGQLRPAAG